jgi:flagellar L-ring protein precursor FlgH
MIPAARFLLVAALLPLAGCTVADRLAEVGRVPGLSPIENPAREPGYRPVSLPMPEPEPQPSASANSLWRSGAKGFFRDQRARRVGDVLTVQLSIADKATLSNESSRARQAKDGFGMPSFFGLEKRLAKVLPDGGSNGTPVDPSSLVDLNSQSANQGRGGIARSETISTDIAAVITQLLPNGNLVIQGRQEIRVNFELREVVVAGIVRPEDITPRNTISHDKIAELRVAYGGRGQITDVQQPRYGAQVLDILLPY